MAQRLKTDSTLFSTVLIMVLFGALMVYSASSVVADTKFGSSYYFAIRQAIWVGVALPLMIFFKRLHYRKLQSPAVMQALEENHQGQRHSYPDRLADGDRKSTRLNSSHG